MSYKTTPDMHTNLEEEEEEKASIWTYIQKHETNPEIQFLP